MTVSVLHLSDELAAIILGAAARAYPDECCGLIEGVAAPEGWRAQSVHEAANLADEPRRHFLIDPELQFKLLRDLRGSTQASIIGCFHSHPGGFSEPSATDLASAYEDDFLWLIAAGSPDSGFSLRGYCFSAALGFSPIELRGGD